MRIAFDAKRAFNNGTGLGNYSRTILRNLMQYYPTEDCLLFTPGTKPSFENQLPGAQVVTPSFQNPLWRSIGIQQDLKKQNPDLYHGLTNELPFGIQKLGIPSVVTIHDVIFESFKEDYPLFDRLVYRAKTKRALRESDRIIAISQATKTELIERFQAPEKKISVLYQACDSRFNGEAACPEKEAAIRKILDLPDSFLLYIGSLTHRKNVLGLIKAWEIMPDRIPLMILGQGKDEKMIRRYIAGKKIGHGVKLKGRAEFEWLPALYKMAETVIYPSFQEGFGLPVVEALACGARVVTSKVSSMPEAGGDLPVYIDPASPESIAEGIRKSLSGPPPDKDKLSRHLNRFNSAALTEQLIGLYREVAGK